MFQKSTVGKQSPDDERITSRVNIINKALERLPAVTKSDIYSTNIIISDTVMALYW
jgi:hypothetical protein